MYLQHGIVPSRSSAQFLSNRNGEFANVFYDSEKSVPSGLTRHQLLFVCVIRLCYNL